MGEIFWVVERFLAFQAALFSMELVNTQHNLSLRRCPQIDYEAHPGRLRGAPSLLSNGYRTIISLAVKPETSSCPLTYMQ
jgi:hypothetical protein